MHSINYTTEQRTDGPSDTTERDLLARDGMDRPKPVSDSQ